jgi:hypothetical protein
MCKWVKSVQKMGKNWIKKWVKIVYFLKKYPLNIWHPIAFIFNQKNTHATMNF